MNGPPFSRIVIVGLGLIGGSLAAACRKQFPRARIIGITRNRRALAQAKRKGWIHEGFQDLKRAFGGKRSRPLQPLIILCTPVDTLKNYLIQLDRIAPPGTVVTDAGSVKGFLVRWADRRPWKRIQFVGAHPMAGSHERGIDAARPDLFKQTFAFVTPGVKKGTGHFFKKSSPSPFSRVKNFWRKICGRVIVISPEEHDRLTAEVSHLPHLVASLLVSGTSSKAGRVAGPGFLDTTRIAQGDPSLWLPILVENRKALLAWAADFERRLRQIRLLMGRGKVAGLRRLLAGAARKRRALAGNIA